MTETERKEARLESYKQYNKKRKQIADKKTFIDENIGVYVKRYNSPYYKGPKMTDAELKAYAEKNYGTRVKAMRESAERLLDDIWGYEIMPDEQIELLRQEIPNFGVVSSVVGEYWQVYTYFYGDSDGSGEMRGLSSAEFRTGSKDRKALRRLYELQLGKKYVEDNLDFL